MWCADIANVKAPGMSWREHVLFQLFIMIIAAEGGDGMRRCFREEENLRTRVEEEVEDPTDVVKPSSIPGMRVTC
jgi:hypothetical protein